MASSLQTAVLGMQAYQEMLNVTSNNIANADTVGYKEDRVTFSDMFFRTVSAGMKGDENKGGVNPIQVGFGVQVASVDRNMVQGSFTTTERVFDMAIDGEGFFVVSDGHSELYTRDGSFDVDASGYLVDPSSGLRVQRIGTAGESNGFQVTGDTAIRIPYDTEIPARYTREITFKGNLNASDVTPTTSKLQASGITYTLSSGGNAKVTSEFADVAQLSAFSDGDAISITGRQRDGTAVSETFTYGAANDGTTVQDLLDKIETAFGGSSAVSATLEEGKLTVTDAQSGYSLLDVHLESADHPSAMPGEFDYLEVGGAAAKTTKISIFDRQGRSHSMTLSFVRQAAGQNVWDLVLNSCNDATAINDRRIAGISFDENGTFEGLTGLDGFGHSDADPGFEDLDGNFSIEFPGLGSEQVITADVGRAGFFDGLTQLGGSSTAGAINQDGYSQGSLQSISIEKDGVIYGTFSNGQTLEVAALKLAVFDNAQGLERAGDNYYRMSMAAGSVVYTQGNQGRAGGVRQNVLEDSNVDIVQEFAKLITAQRGFQINARTVRITNTILQQLANIIM